MSRHNLLRWISALILVALIFSACNPAAIAPTFRPTEMPLPTRIAPTSGPTDKPLPASVSTFEPTQTPIQTETPLPVPSLPAERPPAKREIAIKAIREFMRIPNLPLSYTATGHHSENSFMVVEEYESTDSTFMVEVQRNTVMSMQRKNWNPSGKAGFSADGLERKVREFLSARNPCFGAAEDLMKFTLSGKVGNHFFRWQSPQPNVDRPWDQPIFVQVSISADGTIFGYVDSGICELAQNRPTHVTPIPTDTPIPTPEPQCRLAVTTTADKYPGWFQCTNAKYGFSFRYPPDWTLKEILDLVDNTMYGHAVYLTHPTDPAVRMIVNFKRANEDLRIAPTGIGSGELISRGVVSLLGQKVERIVLVAAGKDMAVYYGWPRSATTGADLVFWLALDCACSAGDSAVPGLTPEVERIADAIVESIEVTR